MNQFRYDIINKNWICIAADRGDRPHSFKGAVDPLPEMEYDPGCPFCPGNEKMIPPIIQQTSGSQGFNTRVIPNKYPIVKSSNKFQKKKQNYFKQMSGFGQHEVLIETPFHNITIASMPLAEVEQILNMYLERYRAVSSEKDIKSLFLFKNHGSKSGTSLQHPHSQLVGLPFVPAKMNQQERYFQDYFQKQRNCLICDYLAEEIRESKRIVMSSKHFVALVPYAASFPYQQIIIPKEHTVDLLTKTTGQISDLAYCLKAVIKAFDDLNPNAPYNLLFNTYSLPIDGSSKYLHWYLNIIPRVNTPAGFEFGSGVNVNSSIPEHDAELLRAQINI